MEQRHAHMVMSITPVARVTRGAHALDTHRMGTDHLNETHGGPKKKKWHSLFEITTASETRLGHVLRERVGHHQAHVRLLRRPRPRLRHGIAAVRCDVNPHLDRAHLAAFAPDRTHLTNERLRLLEVVQRLPLDPLLPGLPVPLLVSQADVHADVRGKARVRRKVPAKDQS